MDDDAPVDAEPICLLCGIEIQVMHSPAVTNTDCPKVAFEEEQWIKYKDTELEHVLVSSCEVENTYFYKYPRLWSSACRASDLYLEAF